MLKTVTITSPPVGLFSKRYRSLTIGMVVLAVLGAFEALAVTTAMPTISRELDGLRLYALAFAAPLATGVLAMVLVGNWSDRSGPRAPLLTTVALFASGLLIAGFADSMVVLVIGRVIQGFGGAMVVAMYVVVARIYPSELHPKVFAAFAAAWVVPSLVGPLAAGLVTQHLGWRWVFLGVAALVVPALVLLVPSLRDPRLGRPAGGAGERWQLGRIAAGAVVALAVLVLHSVTNEAGRFPLVVLVAAAVGAVGAAGWAIRRLVPAGTLRLRRGLPSVVAYRGLIGAAYISAEVYLPLMLTQRFGLTASAAGLVLTAGAITWSSTSWLQGRLGSKGPDVLLIRIGTALLGSAVVMAILTAVLSLHPAVAIVSWGLAGAGMGLMYPRLSVLLLRYSDESEQGFNSAAGQIMEFTGMAVALAATGAAFAALIASGGVAAFLAPFALSLVLSVYALLRAARVDAPER
ncbi:MAG: MFS transporter [Propionibacteriaceae bacterium]